MTARLPGDPSGAALVERILRVDHAGEYGARRIYEGQLAVLGAATALMGERAAMACTVAVEEVIDQHYRDQIAALGEEERPLGETLERFRKDEVEHRDTALAAGAEEAPGYPVLTQAVKGASRLAIWLSERL
jgi:ubiquinone biosynthesis monooxygenase Coq7